MSSAKKLPRAQHRRESGERAPRPADTAPRGSLHSNDLHDRLVIMERELYDKLMRRMQAEIEDKVNTAVHNAMRTQRGSDSALTTTHSKHELALVSQELQTTVRDAVIADINRTIVPQINKMASWVNFQLQDDDLVVDAYRRGVEQQFRSDTLRLTGADAANDKRIISPYVSTFFGEDD